MPLMKIPPEREKREREREGEMCGRQGGREEEVER